MDGAGCKEEREWWRCGGGTGRVEGIKRQP